MHAAKNSITTTHGHPRSFSLPAKVKTGPRKGASLMRTSRERYKDIAGQRFGRLTVIKPIRQTTSSEIIWLCKCDCGATREVSW